MFIEAVVSNHTEIISNSQKQNDNDFSGDNNLYYQNKMDSGRDFHPPVSKAHLCERHPCPDRRSSRGFRLHMAEGVQHALLPAGAVLLCRVL